jgi:N-acetylneuraminic acid mutarotase
MQTGKWPRAGINLSLAVILIVSCAKQNLFAPPASTDPANTKTTNNLIPPPPPPPFPPPTLRIWFAAPNYPIPSTAANWTGRFAMASFAIAGKGYLVAGGLMNAAGSKGTSTDVLCYDPTQHWWSQRASFPGNGRIGMASFVANNLGYVCTGAVSNFTTTVTENWAFNPATNSWAIKAPLPAVARSFAVGIGLNGKGYVGTGVPPGGGADGGLNDWWQYDPAADHWTQKRSLPGSLGRWGAVAFANDVPGGKAYLACGIQSSLWTGLGDCSEYDPVADTWTGMPGLPSRGRVYAVGLNHPDGGIVGTGYSGYNFDDFYQFSYYTKTWSQVASVPGQRYMAQGFAIDRTVYVGGGVYGLGGNPPTPINDFYSLTW